MATQFPTLEMWIKESRCLPNLANDERSIKAAMDKLDPDQLRTVLERRVTELKINGMMQDTSAEIRELKEPIEVLTELAAGLVECEDCEDEINQVDVQVREVIENIKILELRKSALSELKEMVHHHDSEPALELEKEFCKLFETKLLNWKELSTRKKFGADKSYRTFRERIWEAKGIKDDVMPAAKTYLPAEKGDSDEDSDDEDLAMGGATQDYKCPLCITFLNEPVKCQLCRHAFCRGCIDAYFQQQNKSNVPCPQSGCHRTFSRADLEMDEQFSSRVKAAKRRHDREAEKEAEEEDEDEDEQGSDGDDQKANTQALRKKGSQGGRKRNRIVVDDEDDE